MSKKADHPPDHYHEARAVLEATDDGGVPDTVPTLQPQKPPDSGGGNGPESPTESASGPDVENPLLRVPATDGGQEVEEPEETDSVSTDECPDCGEELNAAAENTVIRGQDASGSTRTVRTGRGDKWCPRCELLVADLNGSKEVIR